MGDCFDRPTADVTITTRRVDAGSQSTAMDGMSLRIGSLVRQAQASVTLDNNSTKSTGATFASNGDNYAVEIEYLVTRSSKYRQGVLRITHDGTAQLLDDDFSENNGTVGVTFSLSNTSNITTLNYTTTSTGAAGTMFFSSRILR